MRIEHVALYVEQLERMREFYSTYFGAVSNDGYHNPRTGLRTYFLSFSDGSRLELMCQFMSITATLKGMPDFSNRSMRERYSSAV